MREIFTHFAWISRMVNAGGFWLSEGGQNPAAGKTLGIFLRDAIFKSGRWSFMAHELQPIPRGQKISQSKFCTECGIHDDDESADGIVSTGIHRRAAARPAHTSAPPPPAYTERAGSAGTREN